MHNTSSITKNAIERFVKMKAIYEGKMMVSVRALNAYGPRQVPAAPYGPSRVRKIMPSFICRALSGEPIEIYGDGEQVMDMIYVKNVAEILVTTLENVARGNMPEKTVQAGTGRRVSVGDIAHEVSQVVWDIAGIKAKVTHLPMRPGEPPSSVVVGDPSTLRQSSYDQGILILLKPGIQLTVDYFKGYLDSK